MKILVTGAKGFIGKNLISELHNQSFLDIYEYDRDTSEDLLEEYCRQADIVFHLAGVNRPKNESEFLEGNFGFTSVLINLLQKNHNSCPIILSSSIQALLDNPYGLSKKAGEDALLTYGKQTGSKILIYRLPNVFGKWCRPNYNSVIATFCNNIANKIDINVNCYETELNLVYIDDVIKGFISNLYLYPNLTSGYYDIPVVYKANLRTIVDLLYSFESFHENLLIPDMSNDFTKKLYSTYLSYLPVSRFKYSIKTNVDQRGSFTELFKSSTNGQVSVNITKPGVIKGNHWHNTKNEKFVVVGGNGVIRFRKVNESDIHECFVSADKIEIVDIPCGYIHNIENLGMTDLIVIMWSNECFDINHPDTFYEEI